MLVPGASAPILACVSLLASTQGNASFDITATADAEGTVDELDEGNNDFDGTLTC